MMSYELLSDLSTVGRVAKVVGLVWTEKACLA